MSRDQVALHKDFSQSSVKDGWAENRKEWKGRKTIRRL